VEVFTAVSFQSFAPSLTKEASTQMEKTVITFNDLPEVVTQLRDEVMGLKSLLREQRSVNNAKAVDTHVPMSVKEAADLGIPKGTLYMKLSEGSIPATKPGKRYCLYRDELDRCWNPPGRIPYPCPMRNSANPYPLPTATSLIPVTGKNPWKRIRIISI
jgi:excisionase family DNA binding protein